MEDKPESISFFDDLRRRLLEYKEVKKPIHSAIRFDICAIELAVNFLELKIVRDRQISPEEMKWFQGERYISDTFEGDTEFNDVFQGYLKICELAKKLP